MARIFIDGFESGSFGMWSAVNGASIGSSPPTGMSGIYYANLNLTNYYLDKTLDSSQDDLYMAFKYYPVQVGAEIICGFNDSAGTRTITIKRSLTTPYYIEAHLGAYNGTLLGSGSSVSLALSSTYLIEIYYKPLNTNGSIIIKVNGVTEINVNASADTTAGIENIKSFRLGDYVTSHYTYAYFDDIVLDDANWIGNTKIQAIVPTGAGATNEFDSVVEQVKHAVAQNTIAQGPFNIRQIIPATQLTLSMSSIRLRLGAVASTLVISGCSIGERNGSTDDFASAPTRVTFNNGNNGVTIPSSGEIISDSITFSLDETKDYLVHFYITSTGSYSYVDHTGIDHYYQVSPTSDDTLVQSVSYSSSLNRWTLIQGIQSVITDGSLNYMAVSEKPATDFDYIKTSSSQIDTYAMENLSGSIASIKSVAVQSRNWREGNGAYDRAQHIVRPASTDRLATSKTSVFPITATSFQSIWELNPEDSAAWEEADVNGMEAGIKAVTA